MLKQENVTIVTSWHSNGEVCYREYRVDGKLHRDPKDGPAHESFYSNGEAYRQEYWVNGERVGAPCSLPDTVVVDGITYRRE